MSPPRQVQIEREVQGLVDRVVPFAQVCDGLAAGADLELDQPDAQQGHLEMDGKKYCYIFNENNSGELKLYDEEMKKNLLTCNFPQISNPLARKKSFLDSKIPSLLFVLCWYTFQSKHNPLTVSIASKN